MYSCILALVGIFHSLAEANRFLIYDDHDVPALEVHFSTNAFVMYNSSGTLTWDDLTIWEPQPFENFFLLGMRAQPDWADMHGFIEMVKGASVETEAQYIRHPLDFAPIWDDDGGWGDQDVGFWRPQCAEGFRPMGDIAYACDWPCGIWEPEEYLDRVVCVAESLTVPCTFDPYPLWTNDGGLEEVDGSVWGITPPTSGFWMGNTGWEELPNLGRAYCLKEARLETTTVVSTQRLL